MAGTLTIRPDAIIGQTGWVAAPSGTHTACISDNSDTTYITDTVGGNAYATCYFEHQFGTAALPVGAVIKQVTPFIRCSQASGNVKLRVECNKDFSFFGVDRNKYTIPLTDVTPTSTIKTFTLGSGGTFTPYKDFFNLITPQAVLDGLTMRVKSMAVNNVADDHRVHDVWFTIEYDDAPLASALTLSPADANVRTVRPKITWTYSDPEGAPQQGFALTVWKQSDTADPNFLPFGDGLGNSYTSSIYSFLHTDGTRHGPVYLHNDSSTSETGHQLTRDLANNATYVAYARVFDTTGKGPNRAIGAEATYPSSSGLTFTMQVPAPPAPPAGGIVATYEPTKYRVKLDLASSTSTVPAAWAGLESLPTAPTYINATGAIDTNVANVLTGAGSFKATSVAAGTYAATLPTESRADVSGYYASGAGALIISHVKRSAARDLSVFATVYNAAGGVIITRSFGWNQAQTLASNVNGFVPIMLKFTNAELGNTAVSIGLKFQITGALAAGENFWVDSYAVRPARGPINWLANPSFERGVTGPGDFWAGFADLITTPAYAFRTGIGADPALQLFGSRAVRLTGTSTGAAAYLGVTQRTACIPLVGTTIKVGGSFEVYQAPAGTNYYVQAIFYDVANAQVGATLTAQATVTAINGRMIAKPVSAAMAIPAGAVQVVVSAYAYTVTNTGAYTVTVDGVFLIDANVTLAAGELPQSDWTLGGLVDTQVAIVERSFDAGANWHPIPAMTVDYAGDMIGSELSTSGQLATAYDTIVIVNATPYYRFRTRSYDSALGLYIYSDWSPTTTCVGNPVTTGTGKAGLRSVTDPEQYAAFPIEAEEGFTYTSGTKQGVFNPIGGAYPIVVQDNTEGEVLPFRAMFTNGLEAGAFQNLRGSKEMMWLVRDVEKDGWFVHFTGELETTEIRNAARANVLTRDVRISGTLTRVAGTPGQPAWFWVT